MTAPRLLAVSHACSVAENQTVYGHLQALGWDVHLVVPHLWVHEYAPDSFPPAVLAGLEGRVDAQRVLGAGRVQRHVYLRRPSSVLRRVQPDVVFIEEEHYSLVARQWAGAVIRHRIPYGVQADENLDRPLPPLVRRFRRRVLGGAGFVAARSPTAARLAREWGARGATPIPPLARVSA